jgi:uncharacterized membrane protein YccC
VASWHLKPADNQISKASATQLKSAQQRQRERQHSKSNLRHVQERWRVLSQRMHSMHSARIRSAEQWHPHPEAIERTQAAWEMRSANSNFKQINGDRESEN